MNLKHYKETPEQRKERLSHPQPQHQVVPVKVKKIPRKRKHKEKIED